MKAFSSSSGNLSTDRMSSSEELDDAQSLNALYQRARRLHTTAGYRAFLDFLARLPQYSLFNCALLHIQRPGALYFATRSQWRRDFRRHVEAAARPCVILQPFGPVLFVFAAGATVRGDGGAALPKRITNPFAVGGDLSPAVWNRTCTHAETQERVKLQFDPRLAQGYGGFIAPNGPRFNVPDSFTHVITLQGRDTAQVAQSSGGATLEHASVSIEEQYGILTHELAHLFCGHLGTADSDWWRPRTTLSKAQREIEAESVAYLVCRRAGLHSYSERYLRGHLMQSEADPTLQSGAPVPASAEASAQLSGDCDTLPQISVEAVLEATKYIEQMGQTGFASKRTVT